MSKDWTGNYHSIWKTLGASSHTEEERQKDDYYATDPTAIDKLLTVEKPYPIIWECACGEGHLSERLKKFGYLVYSTDLIDRGYSSGGIRLSSNDFSTESGYKLRHTNQPAVQICKRICFESVRVG